MSCYKGMGCKAEVNWEDKHVCVCVQCACTCNETEREGPTNKNDQPCNGMPHAQSRTQAHTTDHYHVQ